MPHIVKVSFLSTQVAFLWSFQVQQYQGFSRLAFWLTTIFTTIILSYILETVQDFLINKDIKPLIHLLEISIFSLNNDLVRLAKIMNNLVKDLKILTFKVIFKYRKLVESFQKKKSVKNIWLEDQLIFMKFFENFDF